MLLLQTSGNHLSLYVEIGERLIFKQDNFNKNKPKGNSQNNYIKSWPKTSKTILRIGFPLEALKETSKHLQTQAKICSIQKNKPPFRERAVLPGRLQPAWRATPRCSLHFRGGAACRARASAGAAAAAGGPDQTYPSERAGREARWFSERM